MKINVIFFNCPNEPLGGAKVVYEYANYFAQEGNDVTIYFWANNMLISLPEFIRRPIISTVVKYFRPKWFKFDKGINKKVVFKVDDKTIDDADVILATYIDTAVEVNKLHKNAKKAYFIQDYENWYHPDEQVIETYGYDMTKIVISQWLKEIVDRHSAQPAILIRNSINTGIFRVTNQLNSREKHGLVMQYRKAAIKGCEYAFEAIRKIAKKYPDLHVDVISNEEAPADLPECCTYHKSISAEEVAELNNKNSIFLCTSIAEGFGLPGLEAMACGCTFVSFSYQGCLEYAEDGRNALLSPIKDANALVNNVIRLFEDDEKRIALAAQGSKDAAEWTMKYSGDKFLNVLQEMTRSAE